MRNPDLAPPPPSDGAAPSPRPAPPWQRMAAALVLLVAAIAVFAPSLEYRLVEYDDPLYVKDVPMVQRGLTGQGVRWAFSTFQAWNWHPLTWISLMGDVELFGQDPKALHRTNVALHVANALLLFALLGSATQAWGRSFFAAGLFALHPLHVESVAWVAERKDVLSTFFGLLTIGAYFAYARRPGALRYTGVCVLFALGLMAKPMLVTLPVLLLLLDVWPLGRLSWPSAGRSGNRVAAWLSHARPRLSEKLPLLALSLVSSVLTYRAQVSDARLTNMVPLSIRLLNALLSLVRYLKKTALPENLSAHYPYRLPLRLDEVLLCAGVLALFTALAFRLRRRTPAVLVGWLWYLVALLPVLGFFQVGTQSMADRYTYLPLLGIFVAVVWGADALRERLRIPSPALASLGVAVLLLLALQARAQVLVWRDTRSLFEHAIAASGGSAEAYMGLGLAELEAGQLETAAEDFRSAKLFFPRTDLPSLLEGKVAVLQGHADQAERAYGEAIALAPNAPDAYFNLGLIYLQTGRPEQAVRAFEKVLALSPDYPEARERLEAAQGRAAAPDR
ncbi:MAG TPA: tetratricopeptide repeat protein [Myxococcota bacterium]|nr:tetratricopeptide repeat protein [Myxococcota bacterium]